MSKKAGTFFYPPHSSESCEKLGPLVRHRVEVFGSSDRAWDDIVIAGMGWVSISGYGTKVLDIWVPKGLSRHVAACRHEVPDLGFHDPS
eukprot:g26053.t1